MREIATIARDIYRLQVQHIEEFAAAYFQKTHLDPREAKLVSRQTLTDTGVKLEYWFEPFPSESEIEIYRKRADLAEAATSLALVEDSKTIKQLNEAERTLAEFLAESNAEIEQFNAGYEAGEKGGLDPFADQPHYEPDYDAWRSGYYAGSYERLTKELAELKERTRWISVGERHPVEELTVLITGGDEVVETGTRYRGDWWQNGRKVKGVTHWQLLPYPPEADHD